MSRLVRLSTVVLLAVGLSPRPAPAFCGFYVAKADTKLFNKASQVAMVRLQDRTVMTMANDFKGDPREFAIVVPVPTFLEKGQIHVGDKALLEHLDAYTAPRLVEYFDADPCARAEYDRVYKSAAKPSSAPAGAKRDRSLGVTVEARYTVGEYDILILSARESDGLERWLKENGYRIPNGASAVLESYIKQKMRFFVAKVNLGEQARLGFSTLRPLQVAYESPKFMLPIRLGTVNADGPQELFLFTLTRGGRVETTNYRTVKLPTGQNIPPYVKDVFGDFYRSMFAEQVKKEDMRVVFTEYAWDMSWCDPCAADPLSREELRKLGVFWLDPPEGQPVTDGAAAQKSRPVAPPQAQNVFVTRLHVRYDGDHFPEDLVLQETADRQNFQARYVLQHPWKGSADQCGAARTYFEGLRKRRETEVATLASLTGWRIEDIRGKAGLDAGTATTGGEPKWWDKIWK